MPGLPVIASYRLNADIPGFINDKSEKWVMNALKVAEPGTFAVLCFGSNYKVYCVGDSHIPFVCEIKKKLACASESVKITVTSFQRAVDIMTNLARYVGALQKALISGDVPTVCHELLPLTKCDYFRICEGDMKFVGDSAARFKEPTHEPAVPAAAASSDDDYIAFLTEQLRLLEASCDHLKKSNELVQQQKKEINEATARYVEASMVMINHLRAELKAKGIPDPSKD